MEADLLRFATAGSVDDGKSTLIGRLLFDSKSLFSDQLESVERDGMLYAVNEFVALKSGETSRKMSVRYRTMGDANLTAAVESVADTVAKVVEEIAAARITERGATRGDDKVSEAAMEDRKKEGYFCWRPTFSGSQPPALLTTGRAR